MKRTAPSISTLLSAAPTSHAKLPPIPAGDGSHTAAPQPDAHSAYASLHSTADGFAAQAEGIDSMGHGGQQTPAATSHAGSIHAHREQHHEHAHEQPGQQQWGPPTSQPDHLLLRQPATFLTTEEPAVRTEPEPMQALQTQQQQQQAAAAQPESWLDSMGVPQLQHLSRCSNEEQPGQQRASCSAGPSWKGRRVKLLQLLDSPGTSWVLMVMTLFVIFQEDFKYALLPPSADLGLEAVTLALLVLFLVEIGCSCVVRPHFFLSFYFWLDTVAVLSLAFELPALRAVLLLGATQEYVDLNSADSYLMAAGAQALVSSKAGRAAKMVRLFRQLQLIRLFKQLEVRQRLKRALQADPLVPEAAAAGSAESLAAVEAQVMAKYTAGQSRVGQRLSDLTMKRVISGVLAMLIVLPALEISSGINGRDTPLALGGLQMLHEQALTAGSSSQAFNSSLKAFQSSIQYELAGQKTGQVLLLVIANATYRHNPIADQVPLNRTSSSSSSSKPQAARQRRYLEMQAASHSSWVCPWSSAGNTSGLPAAGIGANATLVVGNIGADSVALLIGRGCQNYHSFVLVDIKWALQAQSVYGIARTLFLACLLAAGAMLIHQDTFKLVLQPVQRMVERVREMAEDPLMQAAVRITPAAAGMAVSSSSGGGTEPGSKDGASPTPGSRSSLALTDGAAAAAALLQKEQQAGQAACGGGGGSASSWSTTSSTPLHSSRPSRLSRIRFWPAVKVHAVTEDADDDHQAVSAAAAPGTGDNNNGSHQALASKQAGAAALQVQHQQLQRSSKSSRSSGAQMLLAGTQRLSGGLAAGMTAAGQVAARLGQHLRQRTSAMKQLLLGGGGPDGEEEAAQGQYETRLLEQSIYKICALLAVGFGDAGAEVIAENIKKEGDLNPIVPGKKMTAVFGFCDIRRFTDTTEVLQEGVMEFVNTIAHLVHGAVAAHGGAANKNIGDAFLLVWKLPKGLDERDVSILSSSGGGTTRACSGGGGQAGASRLRTATLHWPALGDAGSDEDDKQCASTSQAGSHPGSTSATPARCSGLGGSALGLAASGLGSSCSGGPGAEELSRQLSTALQQQVTLKRAASSAADLLPHASKAGSKQGNSSSLAAVAGGSSDGGSSQQQQNAAGAGGGPMRSASSSLGLRRAVLSLKSVRAMPLSAAAKATIINTIADNALASFVLIQVAISVSRLLGRYSRRADLNARMPGFRVQMGFGLHVGWAIEGAIGSEYKIDASYLSPNVNLASRLEAATKQYGVPLLLSRDFVDCLSRAVRAKVRQIDCVTVKGSNQPLGLFCYDVDLEAAKAAVQKLAAEHSSSSNLSGSSDAARQPGRDGSSGIAGAGAAGGLLPPVRHSLAVLPGAAGAARSSVVVSAGSQACAGGDDGTTGVDEAELLLSQDYDDEWLDNPVVAGSWGLSWSFKEEFDDAFQLYLCGDWPAARQALELCLTSRTSVAGQHIEDGPSRTLLDVMAGHNYQAPPGWNGVRELTEK